MTTDVASPLVDAAELVKLHSAVRWAKPMDVISDAAQAAGTDAINQADPKTGNTALHIAAQNGHIAIVEYLISKHGAKANVQNFKGNTPLHMTVEYDMYYLTVYLLSKGADEHLKNDENSEAIRGIANSKVGLDAWNSAFTIFKASSDDAAEIQNGFEALRSAISRGDDLDKGAIIAAGIQKKKLFKKNWDHATFTDIVRQLP
eukprot:GEMP01020917.1.p1 GENE.GEMP01020917.1~~GEMP01020917.1.p1  ORF type:complete len:203 (+),score=37.36 GEMP01020917.1:58-666(+)